MKKLSIELENPIDNLLYHFSSVLSPLFHKLGFTPNGITTLSLIFGLLAIYAFYYDKYISTFVFYFISYLFDCMDGYFARKYKMTSKFGDYYEHSKDWTIHLIFMYMVYLKCQKRQHKKKLIPIIVLTIIYYVILAIQVGCQEKITDMDNPEKETGTQDLFKGMCQGDTREEIEDIMKYSRWLGNGSLVIVIWIILFYLRY